MLDSEPDNTAENAPDEAPKRPRRRAASRPAGPPTPVSQATETVTAEATAQPELPGADAAEAPAKKTAARKTAAKKTAAKKTAAKKTSTPRKTAAKKAAAEPETAVDAEVPAKKTTRKTAAKKAAAKEPATRTAAKRTRKTAAVAPEVAAAPEPEVPEPIEAVEPVEAVPATEPSAEPLEPIEPDEAEPVEDETPTPELSIEDAIASAMNATLAEREQALQEPAPEVSQPDEAAAAQTAEEAEDSDEGEDSEESEGTDQAEGHEEGGGRRRRRRRGGRRRRRGGRDHADDESGDDTDAEAKEADADDHDEHAPAEHAADEHAPDEHGADEHAAEDGSEDESEGDGGEGPRRRRRRRRRRRGEDTGGAPDDPSEVVVRVREPRKASDEVTGIDGSTRMEAKRQRRREGREAGRRRAPIISEAEFLARRESVNRKMIIRQRDDLSQIAVLEDGILVEHYVDRESANSLIGNVYLGRVQNVLPSMEAAFIDIGRGRNAVLYAGEVDWDAYGAGGHDRKVENVLKSGQTVLVQVTKDPVGAKGARLTNHISIPGRYVVYAPGGHLSGISRKLPETERKRLKEILDAAVGESASVIVRTAAEGASEDELTRDVNRLKAQWEDIEKKVKSGSAPQLLYAEPDLTLRIVRDLFTEDFSELIIQGNGSMGDAYDALEAYMQHVAPHLADRMKHWDAEKDGDLFGSYRLDEQIAKGLERKVFLPSGGSLIIDRTEAMTVIDVNTGKFTGSGGNLEATITSNNLEAAEEIVRQLRLRDIGGIIVIDFIDMVLPSNRELLLRRLVECLGRDRTRHQVAEVTSLGLVQMTRKRIGTGLLEAFSTECPVCHGRGVELHQLPVADAKMADGGAREDHGSRSGRRRGGKGRKGGEHKSEKAAESSPAEVSAAS